MFQTNDPDFEEEVKHNLREIEHKQIPPDCPKFHPTKKNYDGWEFDKNLDWFEPQVYRVGLCQIKAFQNILVLLHRMKKIVLAAVLKLKVGEVREPGIPAVVNKKVDQGQIKAFQNTSHLSYSYSDLYRFKYIVNLNEQLFDYHLDF
ncbi:hypothetical protein HUJ04_011020 [Dendroctonus ponderosae]|nr:hypothetical protein HUJ04_011020 [Dendroctonus ponderosae]